MARLEVFLKFPFQTGFFADQWRAIQQSVNKQLLNKDWRQCDNNENILVFRGKHRKFLNLIPYFRHVHNYKSSEVIVKSTETKAGSLIN